MNQYLDIRKRTEEICAPLKHEDYNAQVVLHASPATWQLGHTTWFFEEFILTKYVQGYERFRDNCAFLFNSYYNNVGERTERDKRGEIDFSMKEVYAYRRYVDENIQQLLSTKFPVEITGLLDIGMNHEQQHQELLITDLKFMLSQLKPDGCYKEGGSLVRSRNTEGGWISIEEGIYEIGFDGKGFCYDNELAHHKIFLEAFEISESLVTNGEFIEFIEDNGYERFEFWHDDALAWKEDNAVSHPMYWHKIDGLWFQYTFWNLTMN